MAGEQKLKLYKNYSFGIAVILTILDVFGTWLIAWKFPKDFLIMEGNQILPVLFHKFSYTAFLIMPVLVILLYITTFAGLTYFYKSNRFLDEKRKKIFFVIMVLIAFSMFAYHSFVVVRNFEIYFSIL